MDTNEEIRRRRLEMLCKAKGGIDVVAEQADMSAGYLDQIIKKVVNSRARSDGTQAVRTLSGEKARQIEAAFNLGRGWLDWPFDEVDFRAWHSLDTIQRAFVQGRLASAIDDARKEKVSVEDSNTPPSSTNLSGVGLLPESASSQSETKRMGKPKPPKK